MLLVVVWHYVACQLDTSIHRFAAYTATLLGTTWGGVDLFFVLSGFLITGILVETRGRSGYFRVFYLRRICRIVPLYYAFVGLFWLIVVAAPRFAAENPWLFAKPLHPLAYLGYVQNLGMIAQNDFGANWLGMTWSLALEEQFYLLLPVTVLLVPRRHLPALFVALSGLAVLLRYRWPAIAGYLATPCRLDSLLLGGLCALATRSLAWRERLVRARGALVATFVITGLFVVVLTLQFRRHGDALLHLVLAVSFSALLLLSYLEVTPFATVFRSRALRYLGQISYGVYMFHQAANGLAHRWILDKTSPVLRTPIDAAVSLFALAVTIVLASASYYFFERQFLRLAQRPRYGEAITNM